VYGMDELRLVPFTPASPYFAGVVRLYNDVWQTPAQEAREIGIRIRRHATYPGYRGLVAITPAGEVVGFAYGTTDLPGQWWHDQIARLLGPSATAHYLTGSFAFAELAVSAAYRRQGLGQRLHDALLAGLPHRRATLSTQLDNLPARSLYARLGWQTLLERMCFDSSPTEYVILTRTLR
jgi:ribosomal protein S18 acetylase RimI-like enzyme